MAIRRPDDDSILVLRGGALPAFDLSGSSSWQVVAPVHDEMLARLRLTVTTLRAAWLSDSRDARLYEAAWLAGDVPAGSSWCPLAGLGEALTAVSIAPELRAAISAGALVPADSDRQPWYVPGWLDRMAAWIDGRLADAGLRRRGPIRQIRSWGRSALLQLDTDRGMVWAKEVPAAFAHEIALTGLLADIDPGLVPPVIAVDPAGGRLLLSHVEGSLLTDVPDPAAWAATMSRLGEVQHVLSAERDRLTVAGVAAAPLASLADEIPTLLDDDALLRVGLTGGMTMSGSDELRAHAGDLVRACRALASSGRPDSLDHGDLSSSQVIVGEMGPVILDWSDASITHPFLSLASFLSGPPRVPAGRREEVVAAYRQPWAFRAAGADAADDREEVRLSEIVTPLHLASLYRDRILPGLEQRWEMDRVVPGLLGALSDRLATASTAR